MTTKCENHTYWAYCRPRSQRLSVTHLVFTRGYVWKLQTYKYRSVRTS